MKTSRRKSRELALQVLFQKEFAPNSDHQLLLDTFRQSFTAHEDVWSYALDLLEGVEKNRAEIDQLIEQNASNWTIPRMALVDVNIMRLACFELRFCGEEVPPNVAINEAVEIAKVYGTTESAMFINGILDQIHKAR